MKFFHNATQTVCTTYTTSKAEFGRECGCLGHVVGIVVVEGCRMARERGWMECGECDIRVLSKCFVVVVVFSEMLVCQVNIFVVVAVVLSAWWAIRMCIEQSSTEQMELDARTIPAERDIFCCSDFGTSSIASERVHFLPTKIPELCPIFFLADKSQMRLGFLRCGWIWPAIFLSRFFLLSPSGWTEMEIVRDM